MSAQQVALGCCCLSQWVLVGTGKEGTCGWWPRRRVCFAGEMPPTMGATHTPRGLATLCRCSHTCRPIISSTSGASLNVF